MLMLTIFLYPVRTLRHHGLPTEALHTVFQATAVAKLSWWELALAADRDRLDAFLLLTYIRSEEKV